MNWLSKGGRLSELSEKDKNREKAKNTKNNKIAQKSIRKRCV